jgi:hypothetical protein
LPPKFSLTSEDADRHSKRALVPALLAPIVLPLLFVAGWCARHAVDSLRLGESADLAPSLVYTLIPSATLYVLGCVLAMYSLFTGSRQAVRTVLVLYVLAMAVGFAIYYAAAP